MKIVVQQHQGGLTRVCLDGVEIQGVRSYSFKEKVVDESNFNLSEFSICLASDDVEFVTCPD